MWGKMFYFVNKHTLKLEEMYLPITTDYWTDRLRHTFTFKLFLPDPIVNTS